MVIESLALGIYTSSGTHSRSLTHTKGNGNFGITGNTGNFIWKFTTREDITVQYSFERGRTWEGDNNQRTVGNKPGCGGDVYVGGLLANIHRLFFYPLVNSSLPLKMRDTQPNSQHINKFHG